MLSLIHFLYFYYTVNLLRCANLTRATIAVCAVTAKMAPSFPKKSVASSKFGVCSLARKTVLDRRRDFVLLCSHSLHAAYASKKHI